MKLICNKSILTDAINTVQKAVGSRQAHPILECIHIEADGFGNVSFTCNNTEICIVYSIKCQVEYAGDIALESKMFGEIIRRLPDGDVTIDVNDQNYVARISCGASVINIQGFDGVEYPEPPEVEETFRFELSQNVLRRMIKKTSPFIATTETKRPVLNGALFHIRDKNVLKMVATDGRRMAVGTTYLQKELETTKFVVPGLTLRELLKLMKEDETDVEIIVSKRRAIFDFGYYRLYTRLLEGEYLNYDPILNSDSTTIINVNNRIFTNSLERALLIINDDDQNAKRNKAPVRLSIDMQRIDINCITARGQVHDEVDAGITGDPIMIGFNCRYLMDAISACDDEFIKMELSTPTAGCFIRSSSDKESYIFMVLPVKLYE